MTLTLSGAPLGTHRPTEVNYQLAGPDRLLLFDRFPRRVRAVFAEETVLDTTRGRLLHESALLPVLYVPDAAVRADLLEATEHTTHCPHKGDAAYWSVRVGDRLAENAVWAYPDPIDAASWLRGHKAITWKAMEAWYDEDEQVEGHLRDPYHRVDVRHSTRHVRVLHDGEVLAESRRPAVLSETGLPNRYYLPTGDVDRTRLEPSPSTAICPYKGTSSYWSLRPRDGGRAVADVAWTFPDPLENALKAADHFCFQHPDLRIEVDGQPVD